MTAGETSSMLQGFLWFVTISFEQLQTSLKAKMLNFD